MALSYTATAFNTAGTSGGTGLSYKDVTVTASTGDLLVAWGASENGSSATGSCSTQSGSTSAWTTIRDAGAEDADCGFICSRATVTAGGSITVRVTVRCPYAPLLMGAGVFVRPAAEWTGTPAATNLGGGDADGQVSVTLSTTSTVLYMAGDWTASNPGSTATPAGGTNHTTYYDTTNYAVFAESWTAQASGIRNYGPSGQSGDDWIGVVVAIEEPAAGETGEATVAGAGTVSGTATSGAGATVTGAGTVSGTGSASGAAAPAVGLFSPPQLWTAVGDADLVLKAPDPRSGDLMLAAVAVRPSTATLAPPAGWTEVVNQTATDGGAEGVDTGSVRHYAWTKTADGTEGTGNVTFIKTGTASVSIGQIVQARSATGTYDVAAAYKLNSGDVTAFGGTLNADPGLTAGDLMVAFAAQNGNLSNSSAWALSASGVTSQSTWYEHGEFASTTGNDVEVDMASAMVLAGTSTAAPSLTCTMSAATSGVLSLIRIRQGSGTPRTDTWVRSAGSQAGGSTSVAVPFSEHAMGDRLVLAVVSRPQTATVTTPADWTLLGDASSAGQGTFGADAGGAKVTLFYRDPASVLTSTQSVTISTVTDQSSIGQMFTLSKDSGDTWDDPQITGGGDTTAGTAWSVTGAGNLAFADGDIVLAVSGVNTDAPTAVDTPTLAASGVTFGDVTLTSWWETTTGNDSAIVAATGRVTDGATATPTHTLTFTGTVTNGPAGATAIARFNVEVGGAEEGTATVTGTGAVSAAGTVTHTGAATIAGAGTVTTTARQIAGSTILGAGTVTAAATISSPGSAAVLGAGSVTATGTVRVPGSATVTGSGTVTATGSASSGATATVTGAGTVTATVRQTAGGTVTGTGAVTASGSAAGSAGASVVGVGSVAAAGSVSVSGASSVTGSGTVTATARQAAGASVVGAGAVTASAAAGGSGGAIVTGVGQVTATARVGSGASVTGAGSVTASARVTATASVTGAGSVTAAPTLASGASTSGAGQVTASGIAAGSGTASVAGSGQVAALCSVIAGASIAATGSLTAYVTLAAGGDVTGTGVVVTGAHATASLVGAGSVAAAGREVGSSALWAVSPWADSPWTDSPWV